MVANRHFFTYTDLSILQSKFGDQICTDFISDHLFFFAKFHSISEFFFVICLKSLSFFYPLKLKKKKHLKISFLYKPKSICILSEAKLAISSLIKFLKSMGTCPLENGMCNWVCLFTLNTWIHYGYKRGQVCHPLNSQLLHWKCSLQCMLIFYFSCSPKVRISSSLFSSQIHFTSQRAKLLFFYPKDSKCYNLTFIIFCWV